MQKIVFICLIALALSMPGGWNKKDFDDIQNPIDKEALQASLKSVQSLSNGETLTFKKVVSCQTQIVAGVNYKLVLEFVNSEGKVQFYEVRVYTRPWENLTEVSNIKSIENPFTQIDESMQSQIIEACAIRIKQTVNGLLGDFQGGKMLHSQIEDGKDDKLEATFQIDFSNSELNLKQSFDCHIVYTYPTYEVMYVKDHIQTNLRVLADQKPYGWPTEITFDVQNNEEHKQAWNAIQNYITKNHPTVELNTVKVVRATQQLVAGTVLKIQISYVGHFNQKSVTKQVGVGLWIQSWKNYCEIFEFVSLN